MIKLIQIGMLFFFTQPAAVVADEAAQTMHEVLQIARAIGVVQPYLKDGKYIEYAMGIYRASKRYDVESAILISITQQESGFREKLPEGPAGEIGMCQILKNWLQNEKFKAEFGNVTIEDMKRPAKSFLYQAWILRDLKEKTVRGTLPYWSYYNSRKFENRFKYFLRVNRNVAALRKHAPQVYASAAVARAEVSANATKSVEKIAFAGVIPMPAASIRRPKIFVPIQNREPANATRKKSPLRSAALAPSSDPATLID